MIIFDHIRSLTTGKWDKPRIRQAICLLLARKDRGSTLIGEPYVMLRDSAIFTPIIPILNTMLSKVGIVLPIWFAIFFVVGYLIMNYTIGYLDEYHFHLWQTSQEIGTKRYNPFWQRNDTRWKQIDKKINRMAKNMEIIKHELKKTR